MKDDLTFDLTTNSCYVHVVPGAQAARTAEMMPGRAVVHLDVNDQVVGVELLEVSPAKADQVWFWLREALRRCTWTGERSEAA